MTAPTVLVGPWAQAFTFELPVPPKSKSNFRRSRSNANPWAAETGFETQVTWAARAARPDGWDIGDPDVAVVDRPAIVAVIAATTLLDASNLSKSILDALEQVLYVTDASVRSETSIVLERARTGQGGVVAVARLDPPATAADVLAATGALTAAVADLVLDAGTSTNDSI